MKATFENYLTRMKSREANKASSQPKRASRYAELDSSKLTIDDFISERERRNLEKRLAAAKAIIEGKTYQEITSSLQVSTAMIASIVRMLEIEISEAE